eukprot:3094548-Rhodomonas_salina.2
MKRGVPRALLLVLDSLLVVAQSARDKSPEHTNPSRSLLSATRQRTKLQFQAMVKGQRQRSMCLVNLQCTGFS